VAANLTAFKAKYPTVANVVGGWTGELANTGETIELVDARGNVLDSVEYADEGEWSVRTLRPSRQRPSGLDLVQRTRRRRQVS